MDQLPPLSNWDELSTLYEAALAEPPETREAFLRQRTANRPDLFESILQLLNGPEGGILDSSASDLLNRLSPSLSGTSPFLVPGQILQSRFEIVAFLAQGGMGEVYRAWDKELQVEVALKLLRGSLALIPSFLDRFRREIALGRQISHPNVCRVYDLVRLDTPESDQIYFFAMEYLNGETLFHYLREHGPFPAADALPLARQIAAGLDAIHASGIIHRDLKPSNIMLVNRAGNPLHPVVMDFGLAAPERSSTAPPTSQVFGTPGYLAPELYVGQNPTPAADLFSFGMLLRDLLLGFGANASALPPDWAKVIQSLTHSDPAARPASATAALAPLSPPPATSLSRRNLTLGIAGAGLLFAGTTYPKWTRWLTPPTFSAGVRLLLVPVTGPASASPGLLSQILHDQLRQSAHVDVLDPNRLKELAPLVYQPLDAPLDPAKARQIALREGAPLVLFASVAPLGSGHVLNIALEHQDGGSGHSLGSQSFTARGPQDFFAAAREAALWVRRTTGEVKDSLTSLDQKPEQVSTPSLDALREYMRAERLRSAGKSTDAILAFDAALRYDALFAMAHFRKADIYASLSRYSDSLACYRQTLQALAARPASLREELRLKAMLYYDAFDFPQSDRYYEQYIHHYPQDDYGYSLRISVLYNLGRPKQALASALEAYKRNPKRLYTLNGAIVQYCELGQYDQATPYFEQQAAIGFPDSRAFYLTLWHFCQANMAGALEQAQSAYNTAGPALKDVAALFYTMLLVESGRLDTADAFLRPLADQLESSGNLPDTACALSLQAKIQLLRRNPRAALDLLLRASRLDASVQALENYIALAHEASDPTAAARFAALIDPGDDFACLRVARLEAQGRQRLAAQRPAEAIAPLTEAAQLSSVPKPKVLLSQALQQSGKPTEAAQVLTSPSATYLWQSRTFPPPGFWRQTLNQYLTLNAAAPDAGMQRRRLLALGPA